MIRPQHMTISASLIVRNEATEIYACLETLKGLDEITLVDTGSTDHTLEVIHRWHLDNPTQRLRICHFPWCDDFSAARNFSADCCRGQWILTMDADFRLPPGTLPRLREALATTAGRTLALCQVAQGSGQRNRRVLVHRPGVRWVGAIHEALDTDDGAAADDIEVHYGWSASHHADPTRNLRILTAQAEADPTNARIAYYLGAEHWDRGNLDEAAIHFQRCVDLTTWTAERADAWLYLAKIRWRQSRGEEARLHCLKSLANLPDCREALLLMAEMSWPQQAETWRRFAAIATDENVIFLRSPRPTDPALPVAV